MSLKLLYFRFCVLEAYYESSASSCLHPSIKSPATYSGFCDAAMAVVELANHPKKIFLFVVTSICLNLDTNTLSFPLRAVNDWRFGIHPLAPSYLSSSKQQRFVLYRWTYVFFIETKTTCSKSHACLCTLMITYGSNYT